MDFDDFESDDDFNYVCKVYRHDHNKRSFTREILEFLFTEFFYEESLLKDYMKENTPFIKPVKMYLDAKE